MTRTNHRTRWTCEEDEFLQEQWDGSYETRAVIAELLERSPDAVNQRHYELTWGTCAPPVETKPEPGEPRDRVHVTRVTETVTFTIDPSKVCPTCFTVRAANDTCFCKED